MTRGSRGSRGKRGGRGSRGPRQFPLEKLLRNWLQTRQADRLTANQKSQEGEDG